MENNPNFPKYIFRGDDGSFDEELYRAMTQNYGIIQKSNIQNIDTTTFSPNLSPQDFLSLAGISLEDCNGKNITDIGGGSACLTLYIQNQSNAQKVINVDPIFFEYNFNEVAKDAHKKLTGLIASNKESAKKEGQYQQNFIRKQEKQTQSKEVLEKYINNEYKAPQIEAAYGNNVSSIESDSQDIVFINHLIHKLPYKEGLDIIKEANRILQPTGKIYIIEYPDEKTEIINISKRNNLIQNKNQDAICITIKKGERILFPQENH